MALILVSKFARESQVSKWSLPALDLNRLELEPVTAGTPNKHPKRCVSFKLPTRILHCNQTADPLSNGSQQLSCPFCRFKCTKNICVCPHLSKKHSMGVVPHFSCRKTLIIKVEKTKRAVTETPKDTFFNRVSNFMYACLDFQIRQGRPERRLFLGGGYLMDHGSGWAGSFVNGLKSLYVWEETHCSLKKY